ncbi:MAG: DNA replication/repair protein RecF [Gammaproteobacteria bacterium]|nr:MAG: DNA replication/repair protein RecF [Gammaproteobacteria bacterium]RLA54230.1 MAG: DNA replication/repair protein RecF [Gammaproteobacteria bacterium]
MYVKKLDVQGVRNIRHGLLNPVPDINIIYGENGSGKTSLLEAVYLLGRGRSFRTRNLKFLINTETDSCMVFALLAESGKDGGQKIPMGVSRSAQGAFQFKIAGRQVHSASELAQTLPMLLMNSDSFSLIEGGPGNRRKYLDWGVFHVEHPFRDVWRKFQRCHKQRNYLLRHDKISSAQLLVWDREFVELSEQVAGYRQRYFDKIVPEFHQVLAELSGELDVDLALYRGWDSVSSLGEALQVAYQRDLTTRLTHCGAHRADLKLSSEGRPAAEVLSRGQVKIVVLAMYIAQGRVLGKAVGKQCLYLLDDLAAELDQVRFARGMQLLAALGAQVFLTGISKEVLLAALPKPLPGQVALFHVKQGIVEQEELDSM